MKRAPALRSPVNIREVGRRAAEALAEAVKAHNRAIIFSNAQDKARRSALVRAAAEHAIASNHLERAIEHLKELA